ncbi:MAG: hypothetical protein QOI38_1061 [Sphingomonadales bacterium]|jgi:Na+/H+ antiporter NhaD/arsenite permease-like protein|nr:hypothetical protein [Sphingomonadales bacterium]
MPWTIVIGLVALLFSIICFYLFFAEGTRKPVPDQVVDEAAERAQARNLDPAAIAAFAKALAEAFSKVGPAALALIGAILFLLLAGEALSVFHLTEEKGCAAKQACAPNVRAGSRAGGTGTGTTGGEAGNQSGNLQ